MLDPKEQAKGGFGAQVARQDERHEQLANAVRADEAAAAPPDGTPTPPEDQADGTAIGARPQAQAAPTGTSQERPARRWR